MESMSSLLLLAVFFVTVIVAMFAFEGGLRFGRWRSQQPDPEPQLPVRTLVASILSLLAFILGFTFGLASSHFDERSDAAFDEAIALGTAYHRADFLPDPERSDVRRLLREYIDVRLQVGRSGKSDDVIAELRRLQEQIWTHALVAGKKGNGGQPSVPLMQSLTEVIDVHGERLLADARSRIPFRVWGILFGVLFLSLFAAGYLSGLAGARRSFAALAYAFVFAGVIVMIAAGDVPGPEQSRTNQQPLMDLRARLANR